MDFGIGQIVNACLLFDQIYDRCNAAKGKFNHYRLKPLIYVLSSKRSRIRGDEKV